MSLKDNKENVSYPLVIGGSEIDTGIESIVKNPFDGSVVGRVSIARAEDVESALEKAVFGFEEMKSICTRHRIGMIQKAKELLEKRSEDFAKIIALECGKTIREARMEVSRGCETLRLSMICAEEAMEGKILPLDSAPNGRNKWGFAQRFPAGPVLAITPFNFPLNLALHKIGPAIAVGNSFILKPSSITPITGYMLGRLMLDAGVPPEAVSVVIGPGDKTAEPMANDDRIKVLTFTGSPKIGKKLAKIGGMKLFAFELGSNSAVYVHDDADIMLAADRIVSGAFAVAGQVCISTQRVYAHKKIFDEILKLVVSGTKNLKVGNPLEESTDMGPMVSEAESKRIEKWVGDALAFGAKLHCGGTRRGTMFEPTVLSNVPRNCDIVRKEAFGPVVIFEQVASFDDGIREVNDSEYGLQAGIFTNDINLARKAFEKLDVGGVIVNDVPTWRADLMPYGGNKLSGIGREGPAFAIEHMTVWKAFVAQDGTM